MQYTRTESFTKSLKITYEQLRKICAIISVNIPANDTLHPVITSEHTAATFSYTNNYYFHSFGVYSCSWIRVIFKVCPDHRSIDKIGYDHSEVGVLYILLINREGKGTLKPLMN